MAPDAPLRCAALCSAALRRDAEVSPLVPPLAEGADDRGAPRPSHEAAAETKTVNQLLLLLLLSS